MRDNSVTNRLFPDSTPPREGFPSSTTGPQKMTASRMASNRRPSTRDMQASALCHMRLKECGCLSPLHGLPPYPVACHGNAGGDQVLGTESQGGESDQY